MIDPQCGTCQHFWFRKGDCTGAAKACEDYNKDMSDMKDNEIHVDPFAVRAQKEVMQARLRYIDMARSVALDALLSSGTQRDELEARARLYNAKAEAMEEASRIIGGIVLDDNGLPRS